MTTSQPNDSGNSEYEKELSTVAKNTGIGGGGILIGNVVFYLSSILITRTVGADYYGIYYLATNIVNLFSLVFMFGINSGILKFVSEYLGQNSDNKIKGTFLFGLRVLSVSSLTAFLLLFIGSSWFANIIFSKADLNIALKILAVSLPFSMLNTLFLSAFQGLRLIKYNIFVNNIIFPVLRLILLLLFFAFGIYFHGLLFAQTMSLIIAFSISALLIFRKFPLKNIRAEFSERKRFFKFSRPLYIQQFFNFSITGIPLFFLSYYHTSADTGIYGVGMRLAMLVGFPLVASNMIFAPTISLLYGKGEKATLERLFKTVTKWIFTLSLFAFIVIMLFSESILGIFGKEFTEGKNALYFILAGELVNAGVGAVGFMLMMTGRSHINLVNSILLFILTTLFSFIFVPTYNVVGAGIATALSIAAINILSVIEVYYFEKIHPFSRKFFKPVIAGIGAVLVAIIFKKLVVADNLVFDLLGFIFVLLSYVMIILLLKLDEDDNYIISGIKKKISIGKS